MSRPSHSRVLLPKQALERWNGEQGSVRLPVRLQQPRQTNFCHNEVHEGHTGKRKQLLTSLEGQALGRASFQVWLAGEDTLRKVKSSVDWTAGARGETSVQDGRKGQGKTKRGSLGTHHGCAWGRKHQTQAQGHFNRRETNRQGQGKQRTAARVLNSGWRTGDIPGCASITRPDILHVKGVAHRRARVSCSMIVCMHRMPYQRIT